MTKPRYKWKPLQRAALAQDSDWRPAVVERTMLEYHVDRDGAIKILRTDEGNITYWINDIYQVAVHELGDKAVHLNIRRRDGGPILRDWRHFQLIKNQLIGEECEAVELYPAESRLVDTTNKFHLWGLRDPSYRFPFGFDERDVQYQEDNSAPGLRQRPL